MSEGNESNSEMQRDIEIPVVKSLEYMTEQAEKLEEYRKKIGWYDEA